MRGFDAREGSRGFGGRCRTLGELFARFLKDEAGQDLIEYALLTATIGVASAAAWTALGPTIRGTYQSWNDNLYNLWQSPDPS
jgi:Flp pilus assembly pilin Flp